MTKTVEILDTIKYAAVDRANWTQGEINWDHVAEDVYYVYRDASPELGARITDLLVKFKNEYETTK